MANSGEWSSVPRSYMWKMPKYLVQQPRRLDSMAIIKLGEWIGLQAGKLAWPLSRLFYTDKAKAEAELLRQIEMIQNYLSGNVPRMYSNYLFDETSITLQNVASRWRSCIQTPLNYLTPKNVVKRMLEAVMNNLNSVNLGHPTIRHIFNARPHILKNVTQIKLSSIKVLNECNEDLRNLKRLELNCVRLDKLLATIAENCGYIEDLNLLKTQLSDDIINVLIQLPNLKILNLCGTGVTEKDIEKILMSCDNIEFIDFDIESNVLALALENIIYKENAKTFKLKYYGSHAKISNEHLQLVARVCPQLQKIRLKKYQTLNNYFMILQNLVNLSEIELSNDNFDEDLRDDEKIKVTAYNLAHLRLISCDKLNSNVITYLGEFFPNLQTLFFSDCKFESEKFTFNSIVFKKAVLENLKSIIFGKTRPTDDQFIFLLWHSPKIEFISVHYYLSSILSSFFLTDDIMLKVLDKNPLVYLKTLEMGYSKLTTAVIDQIIENCINNPIIYGERNQL